MIHYSYDSCQSSISFLSETRNEKGLRLKCLVESKSILNYVSMVPKQLDLVPKTERNSDTYRA